MSLLTSLIPALSRTPATERPTVRPQYTVKQTPEAFTLTVALPGVAKDGVDVSVEAGEIKVTGKRAWSKPEGWRALYSESSDAGYELVLNHNDEINAEKIQAELADGILTVSIPKAEAVKPRKIQVS